MFHNAQDEQQRKETKQPEVYISLTHEPITPLTNIIFGFGISSLVYFVYIHTHTKTLVL